MKPQDCDKASFADLKQLLDKLDKVNGKKTIKDIIKIICVVALSVITIIFVVLICTIFYNRDVSVESILSVLLAFFSISIAIVFYFKADDTSSKFYNSSYEFMKDQSNVLGRIEARFGEKFENLISRFDHLESKKTTTEEQMDTKQDEIIKTLNDAIDQLSQDNAITKEELQSYKDELEKKNNEYQKLRRKLNNIQHESDNLRHYLKPNGFENNLYEFISSLTPREINYVLKTDRLQKSNRAYQLAIRYGLCDNDGIIDQEVKYALLNLIDHNIINGSGA